MKNTNKIIVDTAVAAIQLQKTDGSFPQGHNGPWKCSDTPVRVTSHWAIHLILASKIKPINGINESIKRAYDFLLQEVNRPFGYAFHCIYSDNDAVMSNGLIGQAWVIEALIEGYKFYNDDKYIKIAESLILQHKFDTDLCLWYNLGQKGDILYIHTTFNQQLWFSVMSYKVGKYLNNRKIIDMSNLFFDKLITNIEFDKFIKMQISNRVIRKIEGNFFISFKRYGASIKNRKRYRDIENGYLAFSLVGLATLYKFDNKMSCWKNEKLNKIITKSIEYLDKIVYFENDNLYGFQYNPIGFEVAFIKGIFNDYYIKSKFNNSEDWIKKQLASHYDFTAKLMIKNTQDKNILSSRIYELARLTSVESL